MVSDLLQQAYLAYLVRGTAKVRMDALPTSYARLERHAGVRDTRVLMGYLLLRRGLATSLRAATDPSKRHEAKHHQPAGRGLGYDGP